ncbi:MAG: hypothetical protein CMF60_04095 [Magnetococcales bacterium]|mgnify:CR=1 FL=1|nr:hypothetical protein [Magnetococcales bacterium]MEC8066291.1 J domain-containing protein [Pseudomonadota bacterium]|tara:strand:- start:50653 stop:51204 length:552 start_codon:yes stop_codon:yes gene_type:complete
MKKCAWPNCKEEGTFAAPKSTKDIYDRQYFCQEHIKEFNKRWNGLDGMSDDDIFAMQTKSTWNRPTRRFGIHGVSAKTAQFTFANAEDLFTFFKQRQREENIRKSYGFYTEEEAEEVTPDVQEACDILSIKLPIDFATLKKTYLALMKKHHPDLNKGSKKEEDHVKKINVAFQIIQDYIKNLK